MSNGEAEASKEVVRIFYEDLWNRWRLEAADEIVSTNIRFRTSLGSVITGREELKRYVETVRAAFPDFNHAIDEMLAIDDRVVTRVTYSGTHLGNSATSSRPERGSSMWEPPSFGCSRE